MRTLPPFLCQCSVLRVFKAKATQIRRKSKQTLESPRIEPGTSSSEGRALTNWATPAPMSVVPLQVGHSNSPSPAWWVAILFRLRKQNAWKHGRILGVRRNSKQIAQDTWLSRSCRSFSILKRASVNLFVSRKSEFVKFEIMRSHPFMMCANYPSVNSEKMVNWYYGDSSLVYTSVSCVFKT